MLRSALVGSLEGFAMLLVQISGAPIPFYSSS